MTTAEKAATLRALHVPGDPLILVNVWDVASARALAAVPGVGAIATASHAVSEALGVADGEGLSVDDAIAVAGRIARSVELPVTVDFERGYGDTPAGVAANVRRLVEAGAAGFNLEDSTPDGMRPLAEQLDRIRAARAGADAGGVPAVINARVDTIFTGGGIAEAVDRANAYLAAGGDIAFVLGLGTDELVVQAVSGIDGPVSVLGYPGMPSLDRLAELGIARVSFGGGPLGIALAALGRSAEILTGRGAYEDAFPRA